MIGASSRGTREGMRVALPTSGTSGELRRNDRVREIYMGVKR